MKWTAELPTEDGYYWMNWRGEIEIEKVIIEFGVLKLYDKRENYYFEYTLEPGDLWCYIPEPTED